MSVGSGLCAWAAVGIAALAGCAVAGCARSELDAPADSDSGVDAAVDPMDNDAKQLADDGSKADDASVQDAPPDVSEARDAHDGSNDDDASEARDGSTNDDASEVRDGRDGSTNDDASEAGDGRDGSTNDGGFTCGCVPFRRDAGAYQAPITTSLECFHIGASFNLNYAAFLADPCGDLSPSFGGLGRRSIRTYPESNLIGITSANYSDSPLYEHFFDAMTKELVGAVRTSSWSGWDPINCNQPVGPGSTYITVQAGVLPACTFGPFGHDCLPTTGQVVCPLEAGKADAASDADASVAP